MRSFSIFKWIQVKKRGEKRETKRKKSVEYKGKERSLKTTRIHLKAGDWKCWKVLLKVAVVAR